MQEGNRWIVSSHRFKEHASPGAAETERQRLSEKFPKHTFYIYRIKHRAGPVETTGQELERAIADEIASWIEGM